MDHHRQRQQQQQQQQQNLGASSHPDEFLNRDISLDPYSYLSHGDGAASFEPSWAQDLGGNDHGQTTNLRGGGGGPTASYIPNGESWQSTNLSNNYNTLSTSTPGYYSHEDPGYALSYPAVQPVAAPRRDFRPSDTPHQHSYNPGLYSLGSSYSGASPYQYGSYGYPAQAHYSTAGVQGPTISPSELHSYTDSYGQALQGLEEPISINGAGFAIDPQFLSSAEYLDTASDDVPSGHTLAAPSVHQAPIEQHGLFRIKRPEYLTTATNSRQIASFLFLSDDTEEVDKPASTPIPARARPTLNEMRKRARTQQGKRAISQEQESYFKALDNASKSKDTGRKLATKVKSQVRSDTTQKISSSSDPDTESDSDTASEIVEEPIPKQLQSMKPLDPLKAFEYTVIKAVWARPSTSVSGTQIREAMGDHWKILKPVGEDWKKAKDDLKEATAKKDKAKMDSATFHMETYRRILVEILKTTVDFSENKPMLLLFSQLLLNQVSASEFSSPLVLAVLDLMSRYAAIDRDTWERAKFEKIFARLEKKGDDKVKSLAKLVNALVGRTEKSKDGDGKSTVDTVVDTSKPATIERPGTAARLPANGEDKVERLEVSKNALSSKKTTVNTTKSNGVTEPKPASLASKLIGTKKAVSARADGTQTTSSNPTTTSTTKAKANHVAAKPSTFFAHLQSVNKKPATALTGKPSDKKDTSTGVTTAADSKPKFSFADTLAQLTKPKEPVPNPTDADSGIIETAEEKAKRLRKEARRKLRVKFKDDDELVEIRILEHDPEEDTGHDDTLLKDAREVRGEGRALLMHKDQTDIADEEDNVDTATQGHNTGEQGARSEENANLNEKIQLAVSNANHPSPTPARDNPNLQNVLSLLGDTNSDLRQVLAPIASQTAPILPHTPNMYANQGYYPQAQQQRQPTERLATTYQELSHPPTRLIWDICLQLGKLDTHDKIQELAKLFSNKAKQPEMAPILAPAQAQVAQPTAYGSNLQALLTNLQQPGQAPNFGQQPNPFQTQAPLPFPPFPGMSPFQPQPGQQQQPMLPDQLQAILASLPQNGPQNNAANLPALLAQFNQGQGQGQGPPQTQPGYNFPPGFQIPLPQPQRQQQQGQPAFDLAAFLGQQQQQQQQQVSNPTSQQYNFPYQMPYGGQLPPSSDQQNADDSSKRKRENDEYSFNDGKTVRGNSGKKFFGVPRIPSLSRHPSLRSSPSIISENHATNSYQNVLFSIALFVHTTGYPPEHIYVVSHSFKDERLKLHLKAIGWPLSRTTLATLPLLKDDDEETKFIERLETRARREWEADPHGVMEPLLGKRRRRGWDEEQMPAYLKAEKLQDLMQSKISK
ncbi:hypothetical protein MMC25_005549 [Agyrium rufum]|nr:hypothetical protein [Agyrium rufum]